MVFFTAESTRRERGSEYEHIFKH